MAQQPVLFMDSGIGGIPYCSDFLARNPHQSIVYLADRLHFPYGSREKDELTAILSKLMEKIIQNLRPKIIVLACNTATIAALSALRQRFPEIPFVGTVPAIKPAAMTTKTGKIGVLATELTIRQPYIQELVVQADDGAIRGEIQGIAAPELVDFVENRLFSATNKERRTLVQSYLNRFRAFNIDALVLGCTHFLFLLEDFTVEAAPDISIFDSVNGISRRIESLLANTAASDQPVQNRLILTGSHAPEPSWASWADRLGFSLSLLEEL